MNRAVDIIALFAVGVFLGWLYGYQDRNRWEQVYKSDILTAEINRADGVQRQCVRASASVPFRCKTRLVAPDSEFDTQ